MRDLDDALARFRAPPPPARPARGAPPGRDVLLVLPTGSGKSLVFQPAAEPTGGPVVVVSPLVSLMRDQATRWRRRRYAETDGRRRAFVPTHLGERPGDGPCGNCDNDARAAAGRPGGARVRTGASAGSRRGWRPARP